MQGARRVELKAKQPSNVFYFMKNALILESFTTTLTAAGEGNKRKRVLRPTPIGERIIIANTHGKTAPCIYKMCVGLWNIFYLADFNKRRLRAV